MTYMSSVLEFYSGKTEERCCVFGGKGWIVETEKSYSLCYYYENSHCKKASLFMLIVKELAPSKKKGFLISDKSLDI